MHEKEIKKKILLILSSNNKAKQKKSWKDNKDSGLSIW